jgi:hypothetical protein
MATEVGRACGPWCKASQRNENAFAKVAIDQSVALAGLLNSASEEQLQVPGVQAWAKRGECDNDRVLL